MTNTTDGIALFGLACPQCHSTRREVRESGTVRSLVCLDCQHAIAGTPPSPNPTPATMAPPPDVEPVVTVDASDPDPWYWPGDDPKYEYENLPVRFVLPPKLSTATIPGTSIQMTLDESQMTQKAIYDCLRAGRYYEPATSEALRNLLKPGGTFIDVGAHVGYFSLLASSIVGPKGIVWAFEPESKNYAILESNTGFNKNVRFQVRNWAIGDRSEVVKLLINADNDGGHSLWDPASHDFNALTRKQATREQNVWMDTLDYLFISGVRITTNDIIIKIDTEGNELNVLKGARNLLASGRVKAVIAEVNAFGLAQLGGSEAEMRATMAGHGFECYLLESWPPRELAADERYPANYVYNLLFLKGDVL
jgi:FkbM family methyltransferase